MYNNNGSYDNKLAYSVQQDYQREAANFRLARANRQKSSFGQTFIPKSLPLASYIIFLVSLFVLPLMF